MVVGLGNPDAEYAGTRHNVGFRVVDRLAERRAMRFARREYDCEVARGTIGDDAVVLLKPQTFMNRSGVAVAAACDALGCEAEDLVVTYDDMDLEVGRVRVRPSGGAGGHRGIESLIAELGSRGFARVRVGIGRPAAGSEPIAHVLDRPHASDAETLDEAIGHAAEAIETLLRHGVVAAMNRFNADPRETPVTRSPHEHTE